MISLSAGVACNNNKDDSEEKLVDFNLAPVMIDSPAFDNEIITAGDSINIALNLNKQVDWVSVIFQNSEDIISGSTYKPLGGVNSYQQETFISCSSNPGTYYPHMTLFSESGDTTYVPDSTTEPQYYISTKRIIDSNGKTNTEIENTNILVSAFEIIQPNANDESDLRVNIEKITTNQSTLTIDFTISNLSEKMESLFGIDFWGNLDTPPSEEDISNLPSRDGVFHFGTEYCIFANETIHSSIILRKNDNSGVAYAILDRFDQLQGHYVLENISEGFMW